MLTLAKLAALWQDHMPQNKVVVREFAVGGKVLKFNTAPGIMGVVNLSPDSWYRESVCLSTDHAVRRARVLTAQGADLIDVGAESSLQHAARADDALQQSRLLPVVRELRSLGIAVSVETYDLQVARAVLDAGANVLNLTGTDQLEEMSRMATAQGAGVILCYVQGRNVREVDEYKLAADPVGVMHEYFARAVERAARAGLDRILIDPGLGFYYRNLQDSRRRVQFQMEVFLNTFRLRDLGFPVCHALPHAFEYFGDEVRIAEPFFAVLAALGQTDLFRTHEVPRIKAVLDTLRLFGP